MNRNPSHAFVLAVVLAAAACTSRTNPSETDAVLRVGVGITGSAQAGGVGVLADMLYSESLFRKEWDGRLSPQLAERSEWSPDGRTLRIELRQGVRFHDGSRMTAPMVATQLSRDVVSPRDAGPGIPNVKAVRAEGDSTIVLDVAKPDYLLLSALADIRIVHPDKPDIGTGPFVVTKRDPRVETRRFDGYHAGSSRLAGVTFTTYETQRAAWAALLRDEIDLVQEVNRESVEFLVDSSQIGTVAALQPFYVSLSFNLNHPQLKNVEVRRALSKAVDRQQIIDKAMGGRGSIATDPIWPMHWAHVERPVDDLYDPREAQAQLEKAGLREVVGPDGSRRRRLSLECLVWSEAPHFERIALVLQKQLFDIGVDLEIELASLDEIIERAGAGNFETFIIPVNASRTLERVYRYWRSPSPENPIVTQRSGYTGADADLDRLRRSTSDGALKDAVAGLARQFAEDVPAVFIAWPEVTRAFHRRFSTGDSQGRDPFFELWRWRPAESVQ